MLHDISIFASGPTCQLSQYLRITSVLYDQLCKENIPHSAAGRAIADDPSGSLDIANIALIGLGTTIYHWLNKANQQVALQLTKDLCAHWPDIRQWILFLYRVIIVREDFRFESRLVCKKGIVEFLALIHHVRLRDWAKFIPADGEVMDVICNIWSLEVQDPRFSSWHHTGFSQRISIPFNTCLLIPFESGASAVYDWKHILSAFQGDSELIAKVSLCHLGGEFSHARDELDFACIFCDIQVTILLCQEESIRLALLRQGMIRVTAEILASIVDHEWEEDMQRSASRCATGAIALLKSRIEEGDALPFLFEALGSGLVASLLKCETLITTEPLMARRELYLLLGEVLPRYSVYHSVLYRLMLAIDLATEQGLDVKLSKGGELFVAWKKLTDTISKRRRLVEHDAPDRHVQTCQNEMCSKTNHMRMFKRCGGCLHAYYCSQKCQQYDWQSGKHKQYCTRVHQRFVRTHGQMSTVQSKDLKFFDQVILAELEKYRERLSTRSSKLIPVELNFVNGRVDVVFHAQGMNANPFGVHCECESYSNARWKHMGQMVRKGKKPMVLVRAFIPGGISRKVVLQAIPLTVLVEGQGRRRESQVAGNYQFNLIFTCCGKGGSDQAVVVEPDAKVPTIG